MNKIGYMAQSDALYGSLTAEENLHFFGLLYGMKKAEIKSRTEEVMELVNLSADLYKPVQAFSGGMKRRLSLAIAIMHKERREVIASIKILGGKSYIEVDGSNPNKAKTALAALEQAKNDVFISRPDLRPEVTYLYGKEDLPVFDNFGATLIGFIVFFFVFLVSGISFLQERTSGTLEKLLSTPIRRWEIVVGYVLGFGLFTILQSFLISWYCVYVLKVMMVGSFGLILLITLLTAIIALTLGILISTLANNEFQMIQFIPLVIVPQVFFSGLFDLPPGIEVIGYAMPLYYIADALTEVMIFYFQYFGLKDRDDGSWRRDLGL